MRDVVVVRVNDQALNPPDLPVGGVDAIASAHLHLARRYRVQRDEAPGRAVAAGRVPSLAAGPLAVHSAAWPDARHRAQAEIGQGHYLVRLIAREISVDEIPLLSWRQAVELRPRAAEPDLGGLTLGQVHRDEPGLPVLVPVLDHQMGDRSGDRVEYNPGYAAAITVRAGDAFTNPEGCLCHDTLLASPRT